MKRHGQQACSWLWWSSDPVDEVRVVSPFPFGELAHSSFHCAIQSRALGWFIAWVRALVADPLANLRACVSAAGPSPVLGVIVARPDKDRAGCGVHVDGIGLAARKHRRSSRAAASGKPS